MAKNLVQDSKALEFVAPSGGVTSGVGLIIGDAFVIPLATAAEGETFVGRIDGTWTLPKEAAIALVAGDAVYWDGTAGEATAGTSTDRLIGITSLAVAGAATTVDVTLNGVTLPAALV